MNIAFVSTYDAQNIRNWSGLGYYISKSLEDNNNKLQFIGSLRRSITVENFLKKVFYTQLRGKQFLLERTVSMSKGYAMDVARKLATMKADCVFSPGSIPVAYLKTDLPKIIFTDATFACLLNYYEPSSGLSADLIRQGHEIEKECLESCALAVYSSDWAAQTAIQFYGISPSKIKVVPFGANFSEESSETEVNDYVLKKDNQVLKILFNGVNFIRKGGELVLATLIEIEKRGIKVELHMVGIPLLPISNVPGFVINHGFLNKAVPEERALLINLYKTCHFLFLPSKAEAFGCVFCEASSFGMPSISRKTGGVSSAITDGINGFVLNASAGVNEYADLICQYFLDKKKFIDLSLSSFQEYQRRLNWKSTGASLTRLIKQL